MTVDVPVTIANVQGCAFHAQDRRPPAPTDVDVGQAQ